MRYLFVAEKPSLMREVELCYKGHKQEIIDNVGEIEFVALTGHVCTLCTPDEYPRWADLKWGEVEYPMVPSEWKIKAIDENYKKRTIRNIREIINDYDGIIVGTDSDVEGYGIYYLLEKHLGLERKKALRFIEHSLTDREILQSLLTMTDFHNDENHVRFVQSFKLRSFSDWLFGMNYTRLVSVKAGDVMAIGRVKAPTIKLVYDNSLAIRNFKPEDFYTIQMTYEKTGVRFVSVYCEDGKPKRYSKDEEKPVVPMDGTIKKIQKENKTHHAPALFDLASLQSEAGVKYGYSPDKTLDIIQILYEKYKVISYPRTQCRYVSTEKAKEFKDMLEKVKVFEDLAPFVNAVTDDMIQGILKDKKVVNDAEVAKESHDALLPTSRMADLSELGEDEKNILHMIYARLLAQFMPKYEEERTTMHIKHGAYNFIARGCIIKEAGWRNLYKTKDFAVLPVCSENEFITAVKGGYVKGTTKPPRRLTQSSLVAAMANIASNIEDRELKKSLEESKGIGTPATRAEIIKDIIKKGYVEQKKDGLYITSFGEKYIRLIGKLNIVSPAFAGLMDFKIKQVQRGEADYDDVYRYVLKELNECMEQIETGISSIPSDIGVNCPCCGKPMTKDRYNYLCKDCNIRVGKNICDVTITEKMLGQLVNGEVIGPFNCTKKNGDKFSASFKLEEGEVRFVFDTVKVQCPNCDSRMTVNKGGAFCDCGFKVFRKCAGRTFTDKELTRLIKNGRLSFVKGFNKRAGGTFDAGVELNDDGSVRFVFDS